jgi:hypothetical protein
MGIANRIPLRGVVGRMDHLSVDNKHGGVILAALGNNTVEVVAAFSLRDIHSIPRQGGSARSLASELWPPSATVLVFKRDVCGCRSPC